MPKAATQRHSHMHRSSVFLKPTNPPANIKVNSKSILRRAIESLEPRRLLTANPTLSVVRNPTDLDNSVVLVYSAPAGTSLELEYKQANDINFQVDGSHPLDSSGGTHSLTISSLVSGASYQYRIRAEDAGDIAYSASQGITTATSSTGDDPACNSVPLSETHAEWKTQGDDTNYLVIGGSWKPADYNGTSPANFGCQVMLDDPNGNPSIWGYISGHDAVGADSDGWYGGPTAGDRITFNEAGGNTIVGLGSGMSLKYRVMAVIQSGPSSGWSEWKTVSTSGHTLAAPKSLHLTISQYSSTFTWDAVTDTNFTNY